MNFLFFSLLICIVTVQLTFVQAQFGINKNVPNNDNNKAADGASDLDDPSLQKAMLDDPDLKEAIQMFADMSPEEMIETIAALKEELKDDPETLKELDGIIEELSTLSEEEIQKNLQDIMAEEAVAQSMRETLEMLSKADEGAWEKILANKELILDSVIEGGMLSEEEIELFKNDGTAWEDELKFIWSELKKQGEESTEEL